MNRRTHAFRYRWYRLLQNHVRKPNQKLISCREEYGIEFFYAAFIADQFKSRGSNRATVLKCERVAAFFWTDRTGKISDTSLRGLSKAKVKTCESWGDIWITTVAMKALGRSIMTPHVNNLGRANKGNHMQDIFAWKPLVLFLIWTF